MATINTSKNIKKFNCEICDFTCCKKGDYNRHITTRKHKLATNSNKDYIKKTSYCCDNCNKEYLDRTGLWRHKKKCSIIQGEINNSVQKNVMSEDSNNNPLMFFLSQNQHLMEKLIDLMPNINNTNNHSFNKTNNNQFNIQLFLNEHCKNAMNLSDFIESLPITEQTYENTIKNGLTNTITNMFVDGLEKLDVVERPIHCTDKARKTLYIKEDNKWEKDNDFSKIEGGIKILAIKQRTLICVWQDANEGWDKDESIQTKMTNLVYHSMDNIEEKIKERNKIIKKVSENTYLTDEVKSEYNGHEKSKEKSQLLEI